MFFNFMLLDPFLFKLSCKNTHTHGNTRTHVEAHEDSDEYSIVENATITNIGLNCFGDLKVTKLYYIITKVRA